VVVAAEAEGAAAVAAAAAAAAAVAVVVAGEYLPSVLDLPVPSRHYTTQAGRQGQ